MYLKGSASNPPPRRMHTPQRQTPPVMWPVMHVGRPTPPPRWREGTRMHSSRMRTARFSGHLGWEVPAGGGVVCPGGVHLPPWTEFLTHACENITFPQLLLREVMTDTCENITLPQTLFAGGNNAAIANGQCEQTLGYWITFWHMGHFELHWKNKNKCQLCFKFPDS